MRTEEIRKFTARTPDAITIDHHLFRSLQYRQRYQSIRKSRSLYKSLLTHVACLNKRIMKIEIFRIEFLLNASNDKMNQLNKVVLFYLRFPQRNVQNWFSCNLFWLMMINEQSMHVLIWTITWTVFFLLNFPKDYKFMITEIECNSIIEQLRHRLEKLL